MGGQWDTKVQQSSSQEHWLSAAMPQGCRALLGGGEAGEERTDEEQEEVEEELEQEEEEVEEEEMRGGGGRLLQLYSGGIASPQILPHTSSPSQQQFPLQLLAFLISSNYLTAGVLWYQNSTVNIKYSGYNLEGNGDALIFLVIQLSTFGNVCLKI